MANDWKTSDNYKSGIDGCQTIAKREPIIELKSLKRIFLIRHCKAEGQEVNARLTGEGLQQACELADFLCGKKIDLIISSSYERAIATIEPLAQKLNLEVTKDTRLCERVLSSEIFNNWEEKLYDSFQDYEMRLPGGETSFEAMERGISVIQELLGQSASNIAVVTHGNMMCLLYDIMITSTALMNGRN